MRSHIYNMRNINITNGFRKKKLKVIYFNYNKKNYNSNNYIKSSKN